MTGLFTCPDGIAPELSREDYDRLDRVNFSSLKHIDKSPAHYQHELKTRGALAKLQKFGDLEDDDTDARQRGRVVSMAVFEPEVFRSKVVVWTGGQRRGKSWEACVDRNPDAEIITEKMHAAAIKIAGAVRNHPQASALLGDPEGVGEATVTWTHRTPSMGTLPGYSIECKGRLDWLGGAIVDLKNTRNASPAGFGKECVTYGSHIQAAFYTDGVKAVTGRELPYYLIAVEPVAPFVIQVYRIPEAIMDFGRQIYRSWLDRLEQCRLEDRWPGYAEGPMDLELPRWAMPRDDEEN